MNSAHEQCPNSVQTVTVNSALSQNWVVCTVRTPRNQVAHTLRAQCPGRGRCCAHSRLVVRACALGRAHCYAYPVVTQYPGRDTKWPNSLGQVVTSNPGRPQTGRPRSRPQSGVATSFPLAKPQARSRLPF